MPWINSIPNRRLNHAWYFLVSFMSRPKDIFLPRLYYLQLWLTLDHVTLRHARARFSCSFSWWALKTRRFLRVVNSRCKPCSDDSPVGVSGLELYSYSYYALTPTHWCDEKLQSFKWHFFFNILNLSSLSAELLVEFNEYFFHVRLLINVLCFLFLRSMCIQFSVMNALHLNQ